MMINRLKKNENMRGFTLLELLVAITLLAIGLLAAAAMQGVAMNANSHAIRISVATLVAQQVAEDLGSLKAADPLLHTAMTNTTYSRMFDPSTNAPTANTLSIPGAGMFSAEYDIAPDTPITGATQITVRVYHQGTSTPLVTCSIIKRVV